MDGPCDFKNLSPRVSLWQLGNTNDIRSLCLLDCLVIVNQLKQSQNCICLRELFILKPGACIQDNKGSKCERKGKMLAFGGIANRVCCLEYRIFVYIVFHVVHLMQYLSYIQYIFCFDFLPDFSIHHSHLTTPSCPHPHLVCFLFLEVMTCVYQEKKEGIAHFCLLSSKLSSF